MMKKILLLTIFLLANTSELCADVYWLRDIFKRKGSGQHQEYPESYRESRLLDILRFNALFKEDISINGEHGELRVGLLDYTYNEFLEFLRGLQLSRSASNRVNTVIVWRNRRFLVYNAGDFSKAVCFEFDIPYRKHPPSLPHYIPDPGNGAIHTKIVRFPDRGTTYVTFSTIFNAEDAFANCANQLRFRNIRRVGGRGDSTTAGFFMNDGGTEIVLISFDQKFNNGFIYHTEKKK